MPLFARQAPLSFGRAIDGPGHHKKHHNKTNLPPLAISRTEAWVKEACCISFHRHGPHMKLHSAATISVILVGCAVLGIFLLLILMKLNCTNTTLPACLRSRRRRRTSHRRRSTSKDNIPPPYDYHYEYEYNKEELRQTFIIVEQIEPASILKDIEIVGLHVAEDSV